MKRLIIAVLLIGLAIIPFCAYAQSDSADEVVNSDYVSSDTTGSGETVRGSFFQLNPFTESSFVKNGSFDIASDDPMPTDWTFEAYYDGISEAAIDKNDENGSNCLHIISSGENDVRILQTIHADKNKYIKISCAIRTHSGASASISVKEFFDARSNVINSEQWQMAELYCYTGDLDTFTLSLRLGYYSELVSGEAWFENVSIEELTYVPDSYFRMYSVSDDRNNNAQSEKDTNMPYLAHTITAIALTVAVFAVALVYFGFKRKEPMFSNKTKSRIALIMILAAGFILRMLANALFKSIKGTFGHSTDIRCFVAWGNRVLSEGPSAFYAPDYFADYPPGYMWILGLCAWISKILGFSYGTAGEAFIFKLPSVICDLASSYLIYKIAVKTGRTERSAVLFACMIALNPLVIFISSVWGQIDIILSLFVCLGYLWFILGEKDDNYIDMAVSGAMYGIAVALKPQALMMGPLYAAAFIVHFIRKLKAKEAVGRSVTAMLIAAVCAFAVIIIPALPFTGSQQGWWLIEKYASTASSYDYATIEAYNLFALTGANWKNANEAFIGGITYKQFGTVCMCVVIALSIAIYVFESRRNKGALFLSSAVLIGGIFAFGHYMHERYLFPAVLFLLVAALFYNDRRLLAAFAGVTVSMLYNAIGAFLIIDYPDARYVSYPGFMKVGAIITLAAFIYLAYTAISIVLRNSSDKYKFFPSETVKGDNV